MPGDPIKFKQGIPYTFRGVTEHKMEDKQVFLTLTIRKTVLPKFLMVAASRALQYPIVGIDVLAPKVIE